MLILASLDAWVFLHHVIWTEVWKLRHYISMMCKWLL